MKKIIFWGAGKVGKQMLDVWRQFGIQPDFFADNQENLWGTMYHGIKVISAKELKDAGEFFVLITCKQYECILQQLLGYGISRKDIFKANTIQDMMTFWVLHMQGKLEWNKGRKSSEFQDQRLDYSVLFDLHAGFVLGGVEAWSMQMAEEFLKRRVDVRFIIPDSLKGIEYNIDGKVMQLEYFADLTDVDGLLICLAAIGRCLPCNIICNFPYATFQSACIAKILWPEAVNLIAVVHNDEDIYYEQYSQMRNIIDYCLVSCDEMEEHFIKEGMAKDKIERIVWKIPCEDVFKHTYSKAGQPIRIGYAGRLVIYQKRMDILLDIVWKLKEKGVDFYIEIAGTGEYEEEMKKNLSELSDRILFRGCLPRNQMLEFWQNQDIGINCSDFEGRCISKAESMAAGAVPVITDTSSAGDDIQDGYNGYILPVGDVDGFVDRICYLYHHREILQLMGERSHQIIVKQNAESDLDAMWNRILKR